MHIDDRAHGVGIRKADVVKEAAAQECVGQLLFVIRGDDHQRPAPRLHRLAGLVDEELHAIELKQQVVGKLDVGLVDLTCHSISGALRLLAISSASTVLPVPGSPLTSKGRSSVIAALTATLRSSVAT